MRARIWVFLDSLGATVVLARNGFEGLQATKDSRPNLVVSDIQMPGMNGFELLSAIEPLETRCRRQCTRYRYDRLRPERGSSAYIE
jgi:CheY-like chemotaxis protein